FGAIHIRQLPDPLDSHLCEVRCGLRAHSPQARHRERAQILFLLARGHYNEAIGLLEVRSDLGYKLVAGSANGRGQPLIPIDTGLDLPRNLLAGTIKLPASRNIQESLVDADLLDQIAELKQEGHYAFGDARVFGHVGPHVNPSRAEAPGLGNRLRRMHAEPARFVRAGRNDPAPPAVLGIRSHDDRLAAELWTVTLLYRGVESIHVHVQDRPAHFELTIDDD